MKLSLSRHLRRRKSATAAADPFAIGHAVERTSPGLYAGCSDDGRRPGAGIGTRYLAGGVVMSRDSRWIWLVALAVVVSALCGCGDDPPASPPVLTPATQSVILAGLAGDYSLGGSAPSATPATRTTTFTIPAAFRTLEGLELSLEGMWLPGQLVTCRPIGSSTYCDTLPQYVALSVRLTAASLPGRWFEATVGAVGNPRTGIPLVEFGAVEPADLDRLLGAEITAEFTCHLGSRSVDDLVVASTGTMLAVRVDVSGQVPEE